MPLAYMLVFAGQALNLGPWSRVKCSADRATIGPCFLGCIKDPRNKMHNKIKSSIFKKFLTQSLNFYNLYENYFYEFHKNIQNLYLYKNGKMYTYAQYAWCTECAMLCIWWLSNGFISFIYLLFYLYFVYYFVTNALNILLKFPFLSLPFLIRLMFLKTM